MLNAFIMSGYSCTIFLIFTTTLQNEYRYKETGLMKLNNLPQGYQFLMIEPRCESRYYRQSQSFPLTFAIESPLGLISFQEKQSRGPKHKEEKATIQ